MQLDPGLGVDRATTGGMKSEMIKPTRTIVSLLLGNFTTRLPNHAHNACSSRILPPTRSLREFGGLRAFLARILLKFFDLVPNHRNVSIAHSFAKILQKLRSY